MGLKVQRFIGWITFPSWGTLLVLLMRVIGRYRVRRIREIRQAYQEIVKNSDGPVIICANHLTKIDSAILAWALAPIGTYMRSFRHFAWNLPERARYAGNAVLSAICYLGSCIPVDRGGSRDAVQRSMAKVSYLLKKGHALTIFPEGKRSLTGKLETTDYAYGVGRLVQQARNCKVLCVYLRGESQKGPTSIPRFGEQFYMDIKQIEPRTSQQGLRAAREIAGQIVTQLKAMEETYFCALGK